MAERRTAVIIGVVVVLVLMVLGAWVLSPGTSSAVDAELSDLTEITTPAAIQEIVELTRPAIATSENYVGHRIRLIRGSLTNVSSMPVRMIEVKLSFTDYEGNTIQEGVYPVFELKERPLDPGTQYRFEVAFEELPRTWNYRVPVMQVVRVAY